MGGRYTVSLAVAHTLLIIWGYAVSAHTNVVHETSTLVLSYPDVLMATVAVFLLLAVGITSARAARRKLSYETWHFIHLYTYLAIALAFSHQFSTGADFVNNAKARWLWSALYISVAALLFWYRLPHSGPGRLPASAASRRGSPRERRRRLGDHRRATPRRARHRGRAVLPLAVPHPRPVVGGEPLLAVGRAPPESAPDHGQGRRRPQRGAAGPQARNPRSGRGTVRVVHRRAPTPAQGSAARRRRRHHPAAGAVRDASRGRRATSP